MKKKKNGEALRICYLISLKKWDLKQFAVSSELEKKRAAGRFRIGRKQLYIVKDSEESGDDFRKGLTAFQEKQKSL